MMRMNVEGRRRKGRPKQKRTNSVNVDLRNKGLSRGGDAKPGCVDATDQKHRLDIEVGKDAVEQEE